MLRYNELPQFLKLKARLAGILEDIDGEPGLKRSAADALERISHEQQTLREGLAVVEQVRRKRP